MAFFLRICRRVVVKQPMFSIWQRNRLVNYQVLRVETVLLFYSIWTSNSRHQAQHLPYNSMNSNRQPARPLFSLRTKIRRHQVTRLPSRWPNNRRRQYIHLIEYRRIIILPWTAPCLTPLVKISSKIYRRNFISWTILSLRTARRSIIYWIKCILNICKRFLFSHSSSYSQKFRCSKEFEGSTHRFIQLKLHWNQKWRNVRKITTWEKNTTLRKGQGNPILVPKTCSIRDLTSRIGVTNTDVWSNIDRLIESITALRKGQGNPIRVSMICNPRRGLPSRGCRKSWTRKSWMSQIMDTRMGFPCPFRSVVIDYFSPTPLFSIKKATVMFFSVLRQRAGRFLTPHDTNKQNYFCESCIFFNW